MPPKTQHSHSGSAHAHAHGAGAGAGAHAHVHAPVVAAAAAGHGHGHPTAHVHHTPGHMPGFGAYNLHTFHYQAPAAPASVSAHVHTNNKP